MIKVTGIKREKKRNRNRKQSFSEEHDYQEEL